MTLKSALEDLSRTTLRAVSGYLRRLEYLAGLKDREGDYSHWGFKKVYGDTKATKAIATAHHEVVSEVLSTPLCNLLEDAENSSQMAGVGAGNYLEDLARDSQRLLPQNPGPGAARHLSSVLHALLGLERNRERNATRRAS